MKPSGETPWLFSARIDLGVFLGSAALSLLALFVGTLTGSLHGETPGWAWVPAVLMVDVAHVYLSTFRVYLDPLEWKKRPGFYLAVPLVGYFVGTVLYALGPWVFWRALAYLAVFHFVRQQYGWVALYRARAGETDRTDRWIDNAGVYAATLYPLIFWHSKLPRRFWWFLHDDFVAIPAECERWARPLYYLSLGVYALRSLVRWRAGRGNPGKDTVVATTALCWYLGIVAFNSDYAFTVTNVFIHGIPYFALVYLFGRARARSQASGYRIFRHAPFGLLFSVWTLAYFEELLWDRAVWQENSWLFGESQGAEGLKPWLIPLLATPQLTHYVLDGFVWKRRNNPEISGISGEPRPAPRL